jgi:hypothetical protein
MSIYVVDVAGSTPEFRVVAVVLVVLVSVLPVCTRPLLC